MGDGSLTVVDFKPRLHGLDGLGDDDSSEMPRAMSGTSNPPTVMIAKKASSMILEDRREYPEGMPRAPA